MTFKTDNGVYASIHEAALTDFPEMTLKHTEGCHFKSELASWPDGVKARFAGGTFVTPWRSIQIAPKAVGLINSGLILNLNEPCVLEGDLSWIRPMKYVGIWWGMHLGVETWTMDERHGATTANAKRYIDFAAANNIEAVMFEGWNEGWESWGGMQTFDYTKPYADFDMAEVARYAKEKGIEIIGHHETGGNIFNYERQLDNAYKWYADLGVHSVKTGYAGGLPGGHSHHGQFNVRHYRKVVQTAAGYHTTVNAHEPIKDTGIRRTYPNMMTREGARGMEWNGWSEGNPPEHHELLPFTRLLGGPMDYTPGGFLNVPMEGFKPKNPTTVPNSRCAELSKFVIYDSPLTVMCEHPKYVLGQPGADFLKIVPTVWDDTRFLDGYPGEYIVMTKRSGKQWFIGAMNNCMKRVVEIETSFLPAGEYEFEYWADAKNADKKPTEVSKKKVRFVAGKSLSIKMVSGGGYVGVFTPVK